MVQFEVAEDGYLRERSVSALARWYADYCPDTNPLAFEAHFMVMRAYTSLRPDTPFGPQGGLTRARYNVLRLLAQAPNNRLPMTDLVQVMGVSPTNITKLVDGLARDDYVWRIPDKEDKRKFWVELTPAGMAAFEEVVPNVGRHVREIWEGFTEKETRALVHLLAKLRLNLFTAGVSGRLTGRHAADSAIVPESGHGLVAGAPG
jgi:DNA-binding MarR family transcriptional regulator